MMLKYLPPEFIKRESQYISQLSSGQQTLLLIMAVAAIVFLFLSAAYVESSNRGGNLMSALSFMGFLSYCLPDVR